MRDDGIQGRQPPRLPQGSHRLGGRHRRERAPLPLAAPARGRRHQPAGPLPGARLGEALPRPLRLRRFLHLHVHAQLHPQLLPAGLREERRRHPVRPEPALPRGHRRLRNPSHPAVGSAPLQQGPRGGAALHRGPAGQGSHGPPGLQGMGGSGLSPGPRRQPARRALPPGRGHLPPGGLGHGLRPRRQDPRASRPLLLRGGRGRAPPGPGLPPVHGGGHGGRRHPGAQVPGWHARPRLHQALRPVPPGQLDGAPRRLRAGGGPRGGEGRRRPRQLFLAHRSAPRPSDGHRAADRGSRAPRWSPSPPSTAPPAARPTRSW